MGSYDIAAPDDEIVNSYFHWLCDVVHADDPQESYINLMVALFQTEFVWSVENDSNRAEDGKRLRLEWIKDPDILDRPCTMLEMMIALAIRIDDEVMWNPQRGNRTAVWFWEMIDNLGLGELDDSIEFAKIERIVDRKMHIFSTKLHTPNAPGTLFPVTLYEKKCNKSVTKCNKKEIWYQMMTYMYEKYGVEDV